MADIYDWSTTAADNDDADTSINWAEGQAPSTVNNSARALMKRVKELINDLTFAGTVGGTADAITVTSAIGALASNKVVGFKAGSANTGAATINVNALGAKAIRKIAGGTDVALVAGDIAAAGRYVLVYDSAANAAAGAWILTKPEPYRSGGTDVPVADGGTGASTAAGARTNLGIDVYAAATQAEMETATSILVAATPGRVAYHPGVVKCWVRATYSAGAPSINASHNVSSLTDAGVGLLTVNIATAFSSAAYAIAQGGQFAGGVNIGTWTSGPTNASSFALACWDSTGTLQDPSAMCAVAMGDL